jgi:putative methyltransferase (TIGR04325 family)
MNGASLQISSGVKTKSRKPIKEIKKFFRETLNKTPLISDIYRYHWGFPRTPNSFRGVFFSFSEALKAIPSGSRDSYNLSELHDEALKFSPNPIDSSNKYPSELAVKEVYLPSVKQTIKFGEHPLFKFNPSDYPLLVWLNTALSDRSTVFDLGGNVGHSYYTYQSYISYPNNLKWITCDVPEAVKVGRELARRYNLSDLSFTEEFADAYKANILISCGTLQYLELSLADILKTLDRQPQHLLINQVPFYEGKQYITLQNLIHSYVPYKIQNRLEFINSLTALGYELVDSWYYNRTCSIPFHPERFVNAYHGFYFRRRSSIN